MALYKVEVKAELGGVTDLQPANARDYIWTVDAECSKCPAQDRKPFTVNVGSGGAETTIECSGCDHSGSIAIVEIPPKQIGGKRGQFINPYSAKGYDDEWETLVVFKVNGITPLECRTPEAWVAVGSKSKKEINDITLDWNGDWFGYDAAAEVTVKVLSFELKLQKIAKKELAVQ
ncbi:hypothetical protein GQ42DRAFT_34983 [Ramicandelaber brevisporus]|nr:hypothetical protein GQ42DRAFT_34983 [Ramicandelaber brevisporus]